MDNSLVLAAARAAGLQKAVHDFRSDVLAAAAAAEYARNCYSAPAEATAEPWPPMRMREGA